MRRESPDELTRLVVTALAVFIGGTAALVANDTIRAYRLEIAPALLLCLVCSWLALAFLSSRGLAAASAPFQVIASCSLVAPLLLNAYKLQLSYISSCMYVAFVVLSACRMHFTCITRSRQHVYLHTFPCT